MDDTNKPKNPPPGGEKTADEILMQGRNKGVQETGIIGEMKRAYLNYAMSVIVSRALPDVRDGLKPVHRRILYAMHKLGLTSTARFSKSASVVGEVLGKYHPHGDAPVYESLVRMAQEFSMRYPLVKGQGNFGSIDGDPAAAMRYTEVKLAKIADELLFDIDKETVPWIDNFDGKLKEPVYLPAKLPNLLLMGAEGIAVGMATKIPPHNLSEIIDGIILMIDNAKKKEDFKEFTPIDAEKAAPKEEVTINTETIDIQKPDASILQYDTTLEQLIEIIKGPDFPTAGILYGASDIAQAYATGRGKMLIRAKVDSEDLGKGRTAIIINELPYQVNKANLVEKIANLVRDKKIVGISDLRDESDRDGIRVVIELKRDAVYKKVLNNLYKHTELQTSFPMNMVVLVDGSPQTLSLKSILEYYINHRVEVVTNRCIYELKQAKARAHILEGYLIALDNIEEVIRIIRHSKTEPEAKEQLMTKFKLSDIQSQAILDMQLKRLTGLERDKIEEELKKLKELITYLETLLADIFKILNVIKQELLEIKTKFGDARRTRIIKSRPGEFSEEELIENKEVLITLTKEGYIKHVSKDTFKVQHRGGKGVSGFETKDEDNVYYITSAMTHDMALFFTNKGKVYATRVWEIPAGSRTSKGKAIINLINITPDEKITSILTYDIAANKKSSEKDFIFMCTKLGTVKKTHIKDFDNIRNNGIISIKLVNNDELLWVRLTTGTKMIVMATRLGKAIVFKEANVHPTGRTSIGVRGIKLTDGDVVTSMDVYDESEKNKKLIVISENGIGKKSKTELFRLTQRGGKGVKISNIDARTGSIAFSSIIESEEETLLITSRKGQVVKIPLKSIPDLSRTAKGVILMRFSDKNDKVASATFIE
jgi:DNA gyrase subunit A